ncbi:MAG: serine protease [Burkholderiales bacterium]
MMKRFFASARVSTAALLMAAVVAACGGSNTDAGGTGAAVARSEPAAPAAAPAVLQVESRVQPASAVQDVPPIEKRTATTVAPAPARIELGGIAAEKSSETTTASGVRKVGAAQHVAQTATPADTGAHLNWQPTAAGGKIAAISFAAEGAKGLRLGVLVGQLPGSSVLRLYRQSDRATAFRITGAEVLKIIQRNLDSGDNSNAARTWWSPDLGGAEVTLEIELPPGIEPATVEISVPSVSHIFADLLLPSEGTDQRKDVGDAGTCNLDANCYPAYQSSRDAVARMTFVDRGTAFLCTGTLLNDAANDGAPYFLSANHCISTQTAASSLTTDWFYRSAFCGSGSLSSVRTTRFGGAQLLYQSASTDTSFMILNDVPPANAVYAGWSALPRDPGTPVTGLHHSAGDLLKISFGQIDGYSACVALSNAVSCPVADSSAGFYRVGWSSGTTEGGASGSPLIATVGSSQYVIGTLYAGAASCFNQSGADSYGRLDIAFNTALKNWLNPPATGTGPAGRTPVYRFYNSTTGAHFYTVSQAERDFVIGNYPVFKYEGVAFNAYAGPAAGQTPVYRFYNGTTRAHFYTISAAERDFVIGNYPKFQFEGTSWYAQISAGNGSVPLYRFYNLGRGTHFYTISADERNSVIETLRDFKYEGIGYYAWTN